jgi:hypothetical protein
MSVAAPHIAAQGERLPEREPQRVGVTALLLCTQQAVNVLATLIAVQRNGVAM